MKLLPILLLFPVLLAFETKKSVNNDILLNEQTETWDSTLVVHLYYGGGMRYESKNIYFRQDSCIVIDMEQGKDLYSGFAMNNEHKTAVLALLKKHRFLNLKQSEDRGFAHDKATTSICLEGSKKHCISSGSSTEIHDNDRADFVDLFNELETYARTNTASKKKKK